MIYENISILQYKKISNHPFKALSVFHPSADITCEFRLSSRSWARLLRSARYRTLRCARMRCVVCPPAQSVPLGSNLDTQNTTK